MALFYNKTKADKVKGVEPSIHLKTKDYLLGLQWQGLEDSSHLLRGRKPWLAWRSPGAEVILGAMTTPPRTSIPPSAGLKMALRTPRPPPPSGPCPQSPHLQLRTIRALSLMPLIWDPVSLQEPRPLGHPSSPKPSVVPPRTHVLPSAERPLSLNSSVSVPHLLAQMETW